MWAILNLVWVIVGSIRWYLQFEKFTLMCTYYVNLRNVVNGKHEWSQWSITQILVSSLPKIFQPFFFYLYWYFNIYLWLFHINQFNLPTFNSIQFICDKTMTRYGSKNHLITEPLSAPNSTHASHLCKSH